MYMYKKILLIQSLNIPTELQNLFYIDYKYKMKEIRYRENMKCVLDNLSHYDFINRKINKKQHKQYSLVKTILYFDI